MDDLKEMNQDTIRYMGEEYPNVTKTIESIEERLKITTIESRQKRLKEYLIKLHKIKHCQKCNIETEQSKLYIVNGEWEYWKAVCTKCFIGGLLPE